MNADESERASSLDQEEFQRLLANIREQRDAGMELLLQRFEPFLRRLAYDYLDSDIRPKVSGSDIVQASVLEAYQGIGEFAGTTEPEFRQWLRRIVVNNILNQYRFWSAERRAGDRHSVPLRSQVKAQLVDQEASPQTKAIRREQASLMLEKLSELSVEHRQVIELRNREGLTFHEIGTQMDRSSDAVRMLWARAMRVLAAKLKDSGH